MHVKCLALGWHIGSFQEMWTIIWKPQFPIHHHLEYPWANHREEANENMETINCPQRLGLSIMKKVIENGPKLWKIKALNNTWYFCVVLEAYICLITDDSVSAEKPKQSNFKAGILKYSGTHCKWQTLWNTYWAGRRGTWPSVKWLNNYLVTLFSQMRLNLFSSSYLKIYLLYMYYTVSKYSVQSSCCVTQGHYKCTGPIRGIR